MYLKTFEYQFKIKRFLNAIILLRKNKGQGILFFFFCQELKVG